MEQPPNNRKKAIGIIVGVGAFMLTYFAVQQFFKPSFDKGMVEMASELNKTCPIMVDQVTRLDNAVSLPDNVFQYNYTLIDMAKEDINADTVRKYIEPGIVNTVRTSPDMKIFRDHKVTVAYNYKDKSGVFVLKISVTPDMYAE